MGPATCSLRQRCQSDGQRDVVHRRVSICWLPFRRQGSCSEKAPPSNSRRGSLAGIPQGWQRGGKGGLFRLPTLPTYIQRGTAYISLAAPFG